MTPTPELDRSEGRPRNAARGNGSGAPTTDAAWLQEQVTSRFGTDLSEQILASWGATRPALEALLDLGTRLKLDDPDAALDLTDRFPGQVTFCAADYQCLIGADALLVHGERALYRRPDFHRVMVLLRSPIIFDERSLYPLERMRELGFEYYSPDRPAVTPRERGRNGSARTRPRSGQDDPSDPRMPTVATRFGPRSVHG
jgi:hypothetical protein